MNLLGLKQLKLESNETKSTSIHDLNDLLNGYDKENKSNTGILNSNGSIKLPGQRLSSNFNNSPRNSARKSKKVSFDDSSIRKPNPEEIVRKAMSPIGGTRKVRRLSMSERYSLAMVRPDLIQDLNQGRFQVSSAAGEEKADDEHIESIQMLDLKLEQLLTDKKYCPKQQHQQVNEARCVFDWFLGLELCTSNPTY